MKKKNFTHFVTQTRHFISGCLGLIVAATGISSAQAGGFSSFETRAAFNRPGNILISDQFNNRVIEIQPNGRIIWQFGLGPNDLTARSIIGCNDAERVGDLTLMTGTGLASGLDSALPGGAVDNRVILADPNGRIVWQYGQFQQTGSGFNLLNTPVQSVWLPNGDVLILTRATIGLSKSMHAGESSGNIPARTRMKLTS